MEVMLRTLIASLLLLILLFGSPAAIAEDEPKKPAAPPPKPLTDEQAADAVLKVVSAKDVKALKALALSNEPDPWLVADELCSRADMTRRKRSVRPHRGPMSTSSRHTSKPGACAPPTARSASSSLPPGRRFARGHRSR
jgi:hypothetical protein